MTSAGVSIVSKAPYQDVAHDYLNLYYSQELQLMRVRESGVLPVLKTVWNALSPKDREGMAITERDFDKLLSLDWVKISAEKEKWIERWKKEMK